MRLRRGPRIARRTRQATSAPMAATPSTMPSATPRATLTMVPRIPRTASRISKSTKTITNRVYDGWGTSEGDDLGRDQRVAVPVLEGCVLPRKASPTAMASALRQQVPRRRGQQLLLRAAGGGHVRTVAPGASRRIPVRGQGQPVHHPRPADARREGTGGPVLVEGHEAGAEARTGAVPVPAEPSGGRAAARGIPGAAAEGHARGVRVPGALLAGRRGVRRA